MTAPLNLPSDADHTGRDFGDEELALLREVIDSGTLNCTKGTQVKELEKAFAARYGDQVRFYQIWDEPNVAPHWGNRLIEPVAYAQLLKAASAAMSALFIQGLPVHPCGRTLATMSMFRAA